MTAEAEVIIVVAGNAAVSIIDGAPKAAVWAVRTLETETMAADARTAGLDLTLFDAAGEPEAQLLGIVDEVALHHGEHSRSGPVAAIRVVGATVSRAVQMRFESLGFPQLDPKPDGFVARRA